VNSGVTSTTSSGGAFGTGGQGGAPNDGGPAGDGGFSTLADSGSDAATYVDPGCPMSGKIEGKRQCDAAAQTGCLSSEGCVPYVVYGKMCHTEEVGTLCEPAGSGVQGDDCTTSDCAAGYVCVTDGTGFQCASLCDGTAATDECPPGLVCVDLDVDGYYVCG
jgi:hypothetical protein